MADQNVPPHRPRDDRGWDGRRHPAADGYPTVSYDAPGHPAASHGEHGYPPAGVSRGPQWVGPEGLGRQAFHQPAGSGLPTLDDDGDGDRGRVGRRRALVALGGTAAVVAGGAALAMSPQVRGLFGADTAAGDATGATVTDGTPARPSGQQPSTVRTYTEQNESYMGSRAGAALKKNSPSGGAPSPARPPPRRRPR